MTIFHFWFINHAERLLEDMVESSSKGKLKLHVKKFKFNWFSNDMQLRDAVFFSTDTTTATTSYRFYAERINVRVKQILPVVFEKRILIDSLSLLNPDIQVTRLRSFKDNDTSDSKNVSLPLEMGRVYKSIQDALKVLQVNRFRIENGKFTLVNKMSPDELPVTITNIQFHLDNLQVDTTTATGREKILFSDNVALQTHDQDIFFPDGRHRLSFSNFRINILKKLVEFDSCTIAATKGDSSRSSFKIFFDKLQLTNIDFDTLYQKEIIKADSVYCTNPQFRLDVELDKKSGERKAPPKLDELIQQLTGDLKLGFVIVQNGSFDINTLREGRPSSFRSDHNNFEIQGLRIQQNSPNPLTIKSFAMAIRNYENFLRDSTYAMQFDSIILINNSIYLSNFSIRQLQGEIIINSFRMPQFELRGLSWDDLIFDRKLTADRATLYQPVIDYTVKQNKNAKRKKLDVFETLAGIGDIIRLNNLDVSNGKININFQGGTRLELENANMSLLSQRLVDADRISNLQGSVRSLSFRKGLLKIGNLTAKMENVNFTGANGKLSAGTVQVTNKEQNLRVSAKNVVTNSMQIDNNSFITEINGISWQQADVQITGSKGKKDIAPGFVIRNLQGANTRFTMSAKDHQLGVFVDTLSADEFRPIRNAPPKIVNLYTSGKNFSYNQGGMKLDIGRFNFDDHQSSRLTGIKFIDNKNGDSISATIPSVSFIPDLNAILNGSVIADQVNITRPVIKIKQELSVSTGSAKEKKFPEISIGKMTVLQPELMFDKPGSDGFSKIEWHSREGVNNKVELDNFTVRDGSIISAGSIMLALHHFAISAGGKAFDAGEGNISTRIDNFLLKPSETGEWEWRGTIADLRANNFVLDSIGKSDGRLEISKARLSKLAISSVNLLNFRQLVKENTSFNINEITGSYNDSKNHFAWSNASYDKHTKTFALDSFTFHPTLGRDEFMINAGYQTDYLTLRTGRISAGPFDVDKYLADTILDAGTVNINNVILTDYRDKRLPFKTGLIKPLPVRVLERIPVNLAIDKVNVNNANIEYSEVNEKTSQTGVVKLSELNATITGVNNYSHQPTDSLRIRAKTMLMDSISVALNVSESYHDSLSGFLMTVNAPGFDPKCLNPVLVALASIEIQSGMVDTLTAQVVAKEHVAMGEMTLLYHDLKIKVLSNKLGKKAHSRGLFSFLANTLVKNKNSSRKGTVFFERIRERSSLHYLVKITLSGILHSIGIKNNQKQVKRYKKRKT
jgi:hypothetical protein